MNNSSDQTTYFTIEQAAVAEFRDRGSKFIAYAYPMGSAVQFKQLLQNLKKEHPKAVHHCFAYRLGTDENNFRVSDDGEPAGTAGRSILGQLESRQLTNVLVVVVRYFGGTLLGVPGLINAYKMATSMALQITPVIQRQVEVKYTIRFDYTQMNEVMQLVKNFNCTIIEREMQLFCRITVGIPKSRLQELLDLLAEKQHIEAEKCEK